MADVMSQTPVDAAGRLSTGRKLGWGVGDFGLNIFWQALNLLMLPFYTDVLGLGPALAGTVFFIASLFDGVADSVIGAVADRTRTRAGSYRPYLIFASPLLALAFAAAFWRVEGGQLTLFVYALSSQMLLRTLYGLVAIPYSALSARITTDADERSQLAGLRIAFAMLGGMIVTFVMPTIVGNLQSRLGEDSIFPYMVAAGVSGLIAMPFFWICFASTREPAALANSNPRGFRWASIGEDFQALFQVSFSNGPLMRVFLCMIVSSLAFTLTNKCLVYYVDHYLQAPELRRYILPFVLGCQLLGCPLWAWLAQARSKRFAWLAANAMSLVAYLAFFLSDSRDPAIAGALLGAVAFANAAYLTLVWAMIPDTVEYNQWKTGQRHDGKIFGVAVFAKRLALGLNGLLLGVLLAGVGYQSGADQQTTQAVEGVKAIMTLVPLVGLGLSAWAIWGYRLDRAFHAQIKAEANIKAEAAHANRS